MVDGRCQMSPGQPASVYLHLVRSMRFLLALVVLMGATSLFAPSVAAQLLIKQETLADGIVVQVVGQGDRQGLRITRDGKTIYKNMLNGGSITLRCVKASDDGKRYNIAARFGSNGNLYKAYAIVGNKVFPSPKYRNTASGDRNLPASWSTPDRLEIKGSQPNTLSFDPTKGTWKMAKGIVLH
jgi:hypothetical protein